MLNILRKIYFTLPPWSTAVLRYVPERCIFGKAYIEALSRTSSDNTFYAINLKKTMDYARKHTRFWAYYIPDSIDISDVFEIYSDLPYITSDMLSEDISSFVSDEANSYNSYSATTGGNGKQPTPLILSNHAYGIEWAHIHRIWGSAGYKRSRDLMLTMLGGTMTAGNLFRYNPVYNELKVDSFQISDKNFKQFIHSLSGYTIFCIQIYPSLLKILMNRLMETGLTLNPKVIFLTSENVSSDFIEEARSFFQAQVLTWYGMSEKVILAADMNGTGRYISFSSYGYPQIKDPDENGIGEIVGTTFVNPAMPLIKYRTGDYGNISDEGNQLILQNITGRWGKDFLYLSPQEKIPMTAVNLHSKVQFDIIFYQIVQREYAKLEVKILPKPQKNPALILQKIHEELSSKLKNFQIDCHIVESDRDIIRSKRGKMVLLIQNLSEK